MDHFTLSKLLRDLEQPIPQPNSQPEITIEEFTLPKSHKFQSLDYHSPKATLSARQSDPYTWQQIVESSISSSSQLYKIYSAVNSKVLRLKYTTPSVIMDEQLSADQDKQNYLHLKSQTFHRSEDFAASKWGFDTQELYFLARQISELEQKLSTLVESIPQENRWFLKAETLYLLHQIASLLQQIAIAAYPFGPESKVIEVVDVEIPVSTLEQDSLQKVINQATNKLRLLDLAKMKQFGKLLSKQEYLARALRIIQDKIKGSEAGTQEERFMQSNSGNQLSSQDGFTNHTHSIDELKAVILVFQLAAFTNSVQKQAKELQNNSEKSLLSMLSLSHSSSFFDPVAIDPFIDYKVEDLIQLRPFLEYQKNLLEDYYLAYYKLIHRLKQKEDVSQELLETCYEIMQKSLAVVQNDVGSLIQHENLIQVAKIAKNSNKAMKSSNLSKNLRKTFEAYLRLLSKRMQKELVFLRMEMERVDENITYKLLTSQKLLQPFASYQSEINASLDKMIPIILMSQKIKGLREQFDSSKMPFEDLLASFEYLSLLSQSSLQNLERRLPKKRYGSSNAMDRVVQICENNAELGKRVPHLLELRNILILIQALKRAKRKTKGNHENSYIDFKYLQQVADYFSGERRLCNIYQLKSKMLLFLILFKMGHYTPKLIHNKEQVNLRQRVINLMVRQATQGYSHSQLAPSVIRRTHLASSIYVFHSEEATVSRVSKIMEGGSAAVEIRASAELQEKVREHVSDVSSKEDDWVAYITQRLNLMEHELFLNERNLIKREEEYLCERYLEHIQHSLGEASKFRTINQKEFQVLLAIQKYFFQQKYERGWDLLHHSKSQGNNFQIFLDKVLGSLTNVESFKFLKLYRQLEKIQSHAKIMLTAQKPITAQQIRQLTEILNENSFFPLDEQQVIAVLNYMQRYAVAAEQQKQSEEPGQQYSDLIDISLSQNSFVGQQVRPLQIQPAVVNHRLSNFQGISVRQKNPTTKLVTISKCGRQLQRELKQYLNVFTQHASKGISKVVEMRYQSAGKWKGNIEIQIQDNSYEIAYSVDMEQQSSFEEKLVKILMDRIVQIMRLFLTKNKFIDFGFHASQLAIDLQRRTLAINPCFIVLQKVLSSQNGTAANRNTLQGSALQGSALQGSALQGIASLVQPFRHCFSRHFQYNYSVLLKALRNLRSFSLENLSVIFNSTLMLNRLEQAELIISFEQKMAQHFRSFNGLAKLPRDSTFLLKKRMELLADPKIKNYTYYFKLGSVFEQQIIEEEICAIYPKPGDARADFIWFDESAANDSLFDMSDLKDKKQLKYTFQELMQRLKKALTESNKELTMAKINERFPKLVHFLRRSMQLLDQNYLKVMADKNKWLCGILSSPSFTGNLKNAILLRKEPQYQKIIRYQKSFRENICSRAKDYPPNRNKCPKCVSIFQIMLNIPTPTAESLTLVQFLSQTIKMTPKNSKGQYTSQGILSDEHSAANCFLADKLSQHPAVKIFGEQMKRPMAKYYVIVNWWFFLEYNFPFLIDVLSQVQHQTSISLLDEL